MFRLAERASATGVEGRKVGLFLTDKPISAGCVKQNDSVFVDLTRVTFERRSFRKENERFSLRTEVVSLLFGLGSLGAVRMRCNSGTSRRAVSNKTAASCFAGRAMISHMVPPYGGISAACGI